MYWIDVGLAGGSLVISVALLILLWLGLRSTRRIEQGGEERLEMLREQQERLQLLREERRMLEEELEWRRSVMAPLDSNGHSKYEQSRADFGGGNLSGQ